MATRRRFRPGDQVITMISLRHIGLPIGRDALGTVIQVGVGGRRVDVQFDSGGAGWVDAGLLSKYRSGLPGLIGVR